MDYFLFQIFPYLALVFFLLGSLLRFDRDPYTWRSKSSQLLRSRQLVIGSTLFHIGILCILLGHIGGLLTPIAVFDALGISHGAKQLLAMIAGGLAGVCCFAGMVLLIHRRLFDPRIRANTSFADMAILLLLWTITESVHHLDGHEMVKFMHWAQAIVTFSGNAHLFVADVALVFKLHLTLGMFILLVFPFTRLVHALSAPLDFVSRPYQIVRKREH
jgi:nitrate reductase gamma subunit